MGKCEYFADLLSSRVRAIVEADVASFHARRRANASGAQSDFELAASDTLHARECEIAYLRALGDARDALLEYDTAQNLADDEPATAEAGDEPAPKPVKLLRMPNWAKLPYVPSGWYVDGDHAASDDAACSIDDGGGIYIRLREFEGTLPLAIVAHLLRARGLEVVEVKP